MSVSFASAAQEDTLTSDDADEALASIENEIQSESYSDDNLSSVREDNTLSSGNELNYKQLPSLLKVKVTLP